MERAIDSLTSFLATPLQFEYYLLVDSVNCNYTSTVIGILYLIKVYIYKEVNIHFYYSIKLIKPTFFFRFKRLKGPFSTFVLNLATADFANSILHFMPAISSFKHEWVFEDLGNDNNNNCFIYNNCVGA